MSSFIIKDESINKLVNFFISCAYSKEEFKPEITRQINKYGYDLTYKEEDKNPDANNLGQRMKVLNKKAWNHAYKKIGGFNLFKQDLDINEKDLIQILKSLQCFIYQCSEGDIVKDELYLMLRDIERILINYIISHLEEYKKAKWE